MEINMEDLITEFSASYIKVKYPSISFEEGREICKSPFRHIANMITQENMPTIIVRWFGKFEVYPGKIRNMIALNDYVFKIGRINEKTYRERDEGFKRILEMIENKTRASGGFEIID